MAKKSALIFILTAFLVMLSVFLYKQIESGLQVEPQNELEEEDTSVLDFQAKVSFPTDFPQYPGSTISDTWKRESGDSVGSSFVLYTEDPKPRVFEFFKNNIVNSGWTIQNVDEENYVLNVTKEETQGFLVLSDTNESETLISITFANLKNE